MYFARSSRVIAAALLLSLTLSACGGGGRAAGVPALPGSTAESTLRAPEAIAPFVSVPATRGALAFTDSGRRAATAPVTVSITLRYNNQAQLDAFVADVVAMVDELEVSPVVIGAADSLRALALGAESSEVLDAVSAPSEPDDGMISL